MSNETFSPAQQALIEVWDRHTAAEFVDKGLDADRLPALGSGQTRRFLDPNAGANRPIAL